MVNIVQENWGRRNCDLCFVYIEKHRTEMINYEEQKRLENVINAGTLEAVCWIVRERQKHMGWLEHIWQKNSWHS